MKDLTEGSIASHLVRMAMPTSIGMLFQTLYFLVDLYFVSQLGDAAIAGVSAAGNLQFLVMALQFALISMGSALRGTGIVKPTIVVQILTVLLNAVLCPILISGWLTGTPLGVVGAGLATSISVTVGVILMFLYFHRLERFVEFRLALMRPRALNWRRILAVGLPPGAEFGFIFLFMGVIYWSISIFGSEAQAGFGIGSRVMQAIFLPAMAIAFATAPVAGQNMGAGKFDRVRQTFTTAANWQQVDKQANGGTYAF